MEAHLHNFLARTTSGVLDIYGHNKSVTCFEGRLVELEARILEGRVGEPMAKAPERYRSIEGILEAKLDVARLDSIWAYLMTKHQSTIILNPTRSSPIHGTRGFQVVVECRSCTDAAWP